MCLIGFDWQPGAPVPLRLIANRDEFHARPAAPLHRWAPENAPGVTLLGGRDERAGGTWLAANAFGTVAALTNVRDPRDATPAGAPSRGELVCRALACRDLPAWLETLAATAHRYAGFNLLVATPERLWHLHRSRERTALTRVAPGIHGVSNADLNTPWPKTRALCRVMEEARQSEEFPGPTLAAIQDDRRADDAALPETGVGLELERELSAAFIRGPAYGTRATTWLTLGRHGRVSMTEQRFGAEGVLAGSSAGRIG
ncbi:NRDE family protein [Halomonas piscis]|uniref:NRDE family protein n=1 Tax=Halomonas piscis TaxID=3031727 RepID=A0ABY9Z2P1_9GAMM|nr:NRDE family protein [Halomonas piscis]WNK21128.1 NRDE family protein [Halomonas piscis]